MEKTVEIETNRTVLVVLDESQAELMLGYYIENKHHLSKWEPERTADFYTLARWQDQLCQTQLLYQSGAAIKFAAMNKQRTEIVGVCKFTNIVHGNFQACNLGYSIAKKHQGKGYMLEILEAATNHMFTVIGLHRIMANYIADNERSAVVLKRLGFENEGLARSYLKIAGRWQDHILSSKLNPEHCTDSA
ncbi:GNAT family N-acetyltransferase [Shewanella sp. 125m-7]